jgi:hypothetical protein
MLVIKTIILATTMPNNIRGRTKTSKPTTLVHYVVSMDIILTASPKSWTSKG